MAKAEGRIFEFSGVKSIKPDFLEAFPYHGKDQIIKYTTDEFSSVCPFSGLPDIARVIVEYVPARKIVELKSLKYYYVSFRNVGITQEEVTNKVFGDLKKLLMPKYLKVETAYNTRGGIDACCKMVHGRLPDNLKA